MSVIGRVAPWLTGGAVALPTANMVGWYKKGVGQTDAGSGACSAWADQSGSGHNLTASGSARPILQGDGTVLFDGVAQFLKAASFTLNQPATFYARVLLPTTPSGGDGGNRYLWDGNSGNSSILYFSSSLVPRTYAGSFGPVGSALTAVAWNSVAEVINGASSVVQVNGASSATGDVGAGNPDGFTLCEHGGGTNNNFLNAQIAEVILYSVAHDATQRAAVIAYLDSVI